MRRSPSATLKASLFQAWVIIQGLKQLQMSTKVTAIFRPHNIAVHNQSKLPRGHLAVGRANGRQARNMATLWAVMN